MPLRFAMGVGLNIQQRTFAKHSSKYPAPHGTPDTWLCVQWGAGVALASPATSKPATSITSNPTGTQLNNTRNQTPMC